MRVKEIMTQSAVCCSPNTNVGAAVELMWVRNCGMLPVVGIDRKLYGLLMDRDISIAMGTRNRLAGELTVGEIATRNSSRASRMTKSMKLSTPWQPNKCGACRS